MIGARAKPSAANMRRTWVGRQQLLPLGLTLVTALLVWPAAVSGTKLAVFEREQHAHGHHLEASES